MAKTSFQLCNFWKKYILDQKTKMLTYCSGNRVFTDHPSLSPVRPPKIKIWKQIFLDRKMKMFAHCSDNSVVTADISLSLVRYIEKKNLTVKRKCSNTVHGTALVSFTPTFRMCNLQKSRYRRKFFWTERRKCSHTARGTALVPLTPPFHLCKISRK